MSSNGTAFTSAYGYDLADRLSSITYPSGRIVTYSRDDTGRISGITTQAHVDKRTHL